MAVLHLHLWWHYLALTAMMFDRICVESEVLVIWSSPLSYTNSTHQHIWWSCKRGVKVLVNRARAATGDYTTFASTRPLPLSSTPSIPLIEGTSLVILTPCIRPVHSKLVTQLNLFAFGFLSDPGKPGVRSMGPDVRQFMLRLIWCDSGQNYLWKC